MDEEYIQSLPEARDCPEEFMKLAFQCCKVEDTIQSRTIEGIFVSLFILL